MSDSSPPKTESNDWPLEWKEVFEKTHTDQKDNDIAYCKRIITNGGGVADPQCAAEDAVQEAGVALSNAISLGRLTGAGQVVCIDKEGKITTPSARAWYVGVLKKRSLDADREAWRERKRGELASDLQTESDEKSEAPDESLNESDRAAVIERALACLKPRDREIVRLLHFEKWPQRRVAAHLGTTENAVKLAWRAILKKLAARYAKINQA